MNTIRLLVLLLAIVLPTAVQAQQGCIPLAAAVAQIADQGFEFVRSIPVPETGNTIIIYRSANGFHSAYTVLSEASCMWPSGLPLGPAIEPKKPDGTPA